MTTPLAHMTDVLAWDIETTGLNKGRDLVTVVGFYSMRKVSGKGSDALEEHSEVVRLVELDHNGKLRYVDDFQEKAAYIAMLMECAQFLVSFNGVAFDLPFLEEQLHIDRLTMNRWMLKTFDVAEFGKRMWNRSFPLSLLLTVNNMHEGKIGSGLEAIDQARNGLWKELEDYCAQDAKITFQISMRGDIVVPEGYAFRKVNGGKALDDERVLVLHTGQFPEIWHSYRRPSICPCEGLV